MYESCIFYGYIQDIGLLWMETTKFNNILSVSVHKTHTHTHGVMQRYSMSERIFFLYCLNILYTTLYQSSLYIPSTRCTWVCVYIVYIHALSHKTLAETKRSIPKHRICSRPLYMDVMCVLVLCIYTQVHVLLLYIRDTR